MREQGKSTATGQKHKYKLSLGCRTGKFEGWFMFRNTTEMAGFEPHFLSKFPRDMEYGLPPAATRSSLCLHGEVCLFGPGTTPPSASRSQTKSVTNMPLPLRGGDFTATCCLAACL